ncbi:UNVERIFIED_CONTAM: Zan [Trichonephila clavipes]
MEGLFLKFSFLAIALVFCVYIHQAVLYASYSKSVKQFLVEGIPCFLDDDDENVVRGNKFIDDLLHDMLEENGHEYDPYRLEDSVVGFSKKVAFVNVSGEAKLHNGYITGLNSLHRPEHCTVEDEDGKLLVKADLGAGVLDFYYDGTVKFMNFGPTITLHAELAYLEIHMEFTVDSKTGRDGELKKFVIDDMKGMKMSITGLGPMNWAANYIIGGVTSIFQGFLRNFMQKKVRNHIAERLPRYQFPVDGGDIEITVPEIVTETEAPEETVPEETDAPEEIIPEETEAPEEIVPDETEAPEEIVPEETEAPEEIVPDETEAPEDIVPEETEAPEEIVPDETEAPEEIVPEETEAPEDIVPEETEAPEEIVPEETEAPEEIEDPENMKL